MSFDISSKSTDLLERLANSVYDRDPTNPHPLFFTIQEITIVEAWINELLMEIKKPAKEWHGLSNSQG